MTDSWRNWIKPQVTQVWRLQNLLFTDPSSCKHLPKLRSQLTNQPGENTWRFIPESICKVASVLNLCFNRLKCSLTVWNYAGYTDTSFATRFFVTWLCISSCMLFSCVGQFLLRFQCLPYQVPLWSTGAFFPSDEKMWNADGKTRQWQVVRLTRGQLFGELALMGDQPRAATARCAMPQDRNNTPWTEVLNYANLGKATGNMNHGGVELDYVGLVLVILMFAVREE